MIARRWKRCFKYHQRFPHGLSVAVAVDSVNVLNEIALEAPHRGQQYLTHIWVDAKGCRTCRVMTTSRVRNPAVFPPRRCGGAAVWFFPSSSVMPQPWQRSKGHILAEEMATYLDMSVPAGGYMAATRVRTLDRPTREFLRPAGSRR